MPAVRINMRKLKDALRLKFEGGLSHQQIAIALGISKGVVTKYVGLAIAARLDWQAIAAMDEATLERRLLASPRPSDTYAQPDYGRIHQELTRKGVTLTLLWEEYCAQVGDEHSTDNPVKPWRYSQFCENYRQFAKRLKRSMRQVHRAGEKLFIDYAGPTIALVDAGQEIGRANLFVSAMGVSGYCFCLATPARASRGWHVLWPSMPAGGATVRCTSAYHGWVRSCAFAMPTARLRAGSIQSRTPTYFCSTTGAWPPWTVKPEPICWRSLMTAPVTVPPSSPASYRLITGMSGLETRR